MSLYYYIIYCMCSRSRHSASIHSFACSLAFTHHRFESIECETCVTLSWHYYNAFIRCSTRSSADGRHTHTHTPTTENREYEREAVKTHGIFSCFVVVVAVCLVDYLFCARVSKPGYFRYVGLTCRKRRNINAWQRFREYAFGQRRPLLQSSSAWCIECFGNEWQTTNTKKKCVLAHTVGYQSEVMCGRQLILPGFVCLVSPKIAIIIWWPALRFCENVWPTASVSLCYVWWPSTCYAFFFLVVVVSSFIFSCLCDTSCNVKLFISRNGFAVCGSPCTGKFFPALCWLLLVFFSVFLPLMASLSLQHCAWIIYAHSWHVPKTMHIFRYAVFPYFQPYIFVVVVVVFLSFFIFWFVCLMQKVTAIFSFANDEYTIIKYACGQTACRLNIWMVCHYCLVCIPFHLWSHQEKFYIFFLSIHTAHGYLKS